MNILNRLKLSKALMALILLAPTSLFAAAPKVSETSNPVAQILLGVVVALAICIVLLANVVLSAAQVHLKKFRETEKNKSNVVKTLMLLGFLFLSSSVFAAGDIATAAPVDDAIAGLKAGSFYGLISAIVVELVILFFLVYNLRFLLKAEKEAIEIIIDDEVVKDEKSWVKWWDKVNSFKPLKEEAQIDLGHDYDGIRELDNRLPGWWLYGFYFCILVACVYLWRFHVSHTGLSSKEELQVALEQGERDKETYLKNAANNIDENTVTLLTAATDIDAGKALFQANCIACHGETANGLVNGNPGAGPNLTDDYWIHNGGIKDIFKTIKYGWPDKGMKSWKEDFSPSKIAQLASFIKSMKGKNLKGKEPQGSLYQESDTKTNAMDSTKSVTAVDSSKKAITPDTKK